MTGQLPLANLIRLGARDFAALRDFYRRVGWPQVMDDGEFAVFELRGILIAVFPLAKLARDGNTELEASSGGIRFTIGVQVDSADEVDRLTEHMRVAGARVTKEPVDAEFFTGRSAYLCDPEGNYFEIVRAAGRANREPIRKLRRRAADALGAGGPRAAADRHRIPLGGVRRRRAIRNQRPVLAEPRELTGGLHARAVFASHANSAASSNVSRRAGAFRSPTTASSARSSTPNRRSLVSSDSAMSNSRSMVRPARSASPTARLSRRLAVRSSMASSSRLQLSADS